MKTKMAGRAFNLAKNFFKPALANDKGVVTAKSVLGRLGPDFLIFGPLAAAQTPGDGFDKGAAYLASSFGGGLGGATVTAATRGKLGGFGELVGGLGGDYLGSMAADSVMRAKDQLINGGPGLTGWERMNRDQQIAFAADLEKQMLQQYGLLVPGSREYYSDPTTGMGVA